MCYSEFADIIKDIENMDADVITFEAARSDLSIVDTLSECGFKTQVGPGVYDIHSPRIPGIQEIKKALIKMLEKYLRRSCGLILTAGLKQGKNRNCCQS